MNYISLLNRGYTTTSYDGGAMYIPNAIIENLPSSAELQEEALRLDWYSTCKIRQGYFMGPQFLTYGHTNRMLRSRNEARCTWYRNMKGDLSRGGAYRESWKLFPPLSYEGQPFTPKIDAIKNYLNLSFDTNFNACFLNKYENEKCHFNWHSNQFQQLAIHPIIVISLGAERELWFKDNLGYMCRCYGHPLQRVCCGICGGTGHTINPPNGMHPLDQRVPLQDGSLFYMPARVRRVCAFCEGSGMFSIISGGASRTPRLCEFCEGTGYSVFNMNYQSLYTRKIPKRDRQCGVHIGLTFLAFR